MEFKRCNSAMLRIRTLLPKCEGFVIEPLLLFSISADLEIAKASGLTGKGCPKIDPQ